MISASSANDRADQLHAMASRLIEMINIDIANMNSHEVQNANANADEKERLVHAWRVEIQKIKQQPMLLKGIGETQKQSLRDVSKKLETLLEGHAAALKAMKEVTEGLVRSIATEVSNARQAPSGYGSTGAASSGRSNASAGLAVDAKA